MFLIECGIESGMLFQIKAPEIEKALFIIISSSALNIIILVSDRSSPVTMDKRQFLEHILNVTWSKIIMNVIH